MEMKRAVDEDLKKKVDNIKKGIAEVKEDEEKLLKHKMAIESEKTKSIQESRIQLEKSVIFSLME